MKDIMPGILLQAVKENKTVCGGIAAVIAISTIIGEKLIQDRKHNNLIKEIEHITAEIERHSNETEAENEQLTAIIRELKERNGKLCIIANRIKELQNIPSNSPKFFNRIDPLRTELLGTNYADPNNNYPDNDLEIPDTRHYDADKINTSKNIDELALITQKIQAEIEEQTNDFRILLKYILTEAGASRPKQDEMISRYKHMLVAPN